MSCKEANQLAGSTAYELGVPAADGLHGTTVYPETIRMEQNIFSELC
jgi:hypothetical protein